MGSAKRRPKGLNSDLRLVTCYILTENHSTSIPTLLVTTTPRRFRRPLPNFSVPFKKKTPPQINLFSFCIFVRKSVFIVSFGRTVGLSSLISAWIGYQYSVHNSHNARPFRFSSIFKRAQTQDQSTNLVHLVWDILWTGWAFLPCTFMYFYCWIRNSLFVIHFTLVFITCLE